MSSATRRRTWRQSGASRGLRATLDASERPAGQALSEAIARLASSLRTFRHGDGGLALFNGGVEEERGLIDLALSRAAAGNGTAPFDAPYMGFRRINSRHSTLIADTGAPSATGRWAHAGTLSFEMSAGRERLIVNCGGWRGGNAEWREALRGTAAHSTLVVDDTNTATLGEDGAIADGPTTVKVERRDQDGATWIDTSHDGYLDTLGLIHKRRLYVGQEGADVRGEDTLTHTKRRRQRGREFALRFHLHPEVTCAMTEDRRAVLLRLPSGAMWQMRGGRCVDQHRRERLRRRRCHPAAHLAGRADRTHRGLHHGQMGVQAAAERELRPAPALLAKHEIPLQSARQWTNKGSVGCT